MHERRVGVDKNVQRSSMGGRDCGNRDSSIPVVDLQSKVAVGLAAREGAGSTGSAESSATEARDDAHRISG